MFLGMVYGGLIKKVNSVAGLKALKEHAHANRARTIARLDERDRSVREAVASAIADRQTVIANMGNEIRELCSL